MIGPHLDFIFICAPRQCPVHVAGWAATLDNTIAGWCETVAANWNPIWGGYFRCSTATAASVSRCRRLSLQRQTYATPPKASGGVGEDRRRWGSGRSCSKQLPLLSLLVFGRHFRAVRSNCSASCCRWWLDGELAVGVAGHKVLASGWVPKWGSMCVCVCLAGWLPGDTDVVVSLAGKRLTLGISLWRPRGVWGMSSECARKRNSAVAFGSS